MMRPKGQRQLVGDVVDSGCGDVGNGSITSPAELSPTLTSPQTSSERFVISAVVSHLLDVVCANEITAGTQTEDLPSSTKSSNSELVAAILAKLNNPELKLNRRERRALQRELEMAQGIQKSIPAVVESAQHVPAAAATSLTQVDDAEGFCMEFGSSRQRQTGKSGYSTKRQAAVSSEAVQGPPPKVKKVTTTVRETLFKFDEPPTTAFDCVSEPFKCGRLSYVSTSLPVNNFLKLCRFSPSGQHIATTSADNSARIFSLNEDKDELSAAYSIAFSNDGSQLYGGYNACVRIWNTERTGRQLTTIKTWEKQTGGQKSIVSCIAMNKTFDGVYAVATYDGSVGFYSDRSNSLECMFSTEANAITDMHYSNDGQRLFVSPRKSSEILCYDMRNPGALLFKLLRSFNTNQRACFDVDRSGRYLFSGTSEGDLVAFDLMDDAGTKTPVFSRKVAACSVPCKSAFTKAASVSAASSSLSTDKSKEQPKKTADKRVKKPGKENSAEKGKDLSQEKQKKKDSKEKTTTKGDSKEKGSKAKTGSNEKTKAESLLKKTASKQSKIASRKGGVQLHDSASVGSPTIPSTAPTHGPVQKITVEETEAALKKMRPGKATGPDDVAADLWKSKYWYPAE
ncbi:unnamed protein product [Heligmosomoides polygyrus]|uniref:WD repeat-containing protein 79 n=1 Tax=Heligmosomoides polygyrus TaxID=6339 RepID=A0A3P8A3D9_HELPZ|nr:unnamed protein product [Heligmosomoides polygyrus]